MPQRISCTPDITSSLHCGEAISFPHGTRLIATAISALNKVNGKRAIATLCIGGGQAIAYEIKRD